MSTVRSTKAGRREMFGKTVVMLAAELELKKAVANKFMASLADPGK